jgi:hypothetical protein
MRLQDRPWFYFNKEKGMFIISFGLFLFGIWAIIATIIYFISLNQPIVRDVFLSIRFIIQGTERSFLQIIPLILIFYIWKIIDGFIDGIPMTLLDIAGLGAIYYYVLNSGSLTFLINLVIFTVTLSFNFYWFFYIIFFGYLWLLCWEVVLLLYKLYLKRQYQIKTQKAAREFFQNSEGALSNGQICIESLPSEKKGEKTKQECIDIPNISPIVQKDREITDETWITRDLEKIIFESDESPLIATWMDVQGEYQKNWHQFYVVDTLGLIFFGFIYAILVFYTTETESVYLNATSTALFFPLWFILISAYKTLAHYIRAVFAYLIVISIQMMLLEQGVIDSRGIFLVGIIIFISRFFFFDLTNFFNARSTAELMQFLNLIMGIVFIVLFLLLIAVYAYRVLTKHDRMQILVSTKYFYIRRLHTFNNFILIWDFLMAWLWPFNLMTYRDIIQELRYKSKSLNESWTWDYGRLSYDDGIKSLTKYRQNKAWEAIKGSLLIGLGVFLILNQGGLIAYVFIALGFRIIFQVRVKTIKIKIVHKHKKAQGSAFMLTTENVVILYDIPYVVAALIPSVGSYG